MLFLVYRTILKDQGFTNLESFADPKEDVRKLINNGANLSVFTDITVGNLVKDTGYSYILC